MSKLYVLKNNVDWDNTESNVILFDNVDQQRNYFVELEGVPNLYANILAQEDVNISLRDGVNVVAKYVFGENSTFLDYDPRYAILHDGNTFLYFHILEKNHISGGQYELVMVSDSFQNKQFDLVIKDGVTIDQAHLKRFKADGTFDNSVDSLLQVTETFEALDTSSVIEEPNTVDSWTGYPGYQFLTQSAKNFLNKTSWTMVSFQNNGTLGTNALWIRGNASFTPSDIILSAEGLLIKNDTIYPQIDVAHLTIMCPNVDELSDHQIIIEVNNNFQSPSEQVGMLYYKADINSFIKFFGNNALSYRIQKVPSIPFIGQITNIRENNSEIIFSMDYTITNDASIAPPSTTIRQFMLMSWTGYENKTYSLINPLSKPTPPTKDMPRNVLLEPKIFKKPFYNLCYKYTYDQEYSYSPFDVGYNYTIRSLKSYELYAFKSALFIQNSDLFKNQFNAKQGNIIAVDYSLPVIIDKLAEYMANNKNARDTGYNIPMETVAQQQKWSRINAGVDLANNVASQGGLVGIGMIGLGIAQSEDNFNFQKGIILRQFNNKIDDLKNAPSTIKDGANNALLDNFFDYPFMYYVRKAPQKIVDKVADYYHRFGYQVGITGNWKDYLTRYYFNYIKLSNVRNMLGGKMSYADRERLIAIFENGVRIWRYSADNFRFLDFSRENLEIEIAELKEEQINLLEEDIENGTR